MALILVIQPDSGQASTLRHALRATADAAVVVVESAEAALAAIDRQRPDVVLLHAFMTLGEEMRIVQHIRSLPDAGCLQTLTIPQLWSDSDRSRRRSNWLTRWLGRGAAEPKAIGCDPRQFAEQIGRYLSLPQAAS
jgi:PleD family two-component response regulator